MKHLPIHSENFKYIEKSFKEWLDILGYSSSTVYQLPIHIREFFHWLEKNDIFQIQQISSKIMKTYYLGLKQRTNQRRGGALSNSYLNKHLQALIKFSDYLRQSGRKPLDLLNIRRENADNKSIDVLKIEQVKSLYLATDEHPQGNKWEAIASRDKAMLTVFYGCGLRRNEAYHLDVSDINFDRQILHVRKGKNYKERFVPFNKTNAQILQEYVYDFRPFFNHSKEINALFISVFGYRMSGQNMLIRLKILIQKSADFDLLDKNISLHTLRHSIATHLLQNGMSLEKISRFLGHSSLESTQIYTHLVEQTEKEEI